MLYYSLFNRGRIKKLYFISLLIFLFMLIKDKLRYWRNLFGSLLVSYIGTAAKLHLHISRIHNIKVVIFKSLKIFKGTSWLRNLSRVNWGLKFCENGANFDVTVKSLVVDDISAIRNFQPLHSSWLSIKLLNIWHAFNLKCLMKMLASKTI